MSERNLGTHFLRAWRKHRGLSLRGLADRMESEPGVPITSHANLGRIETFEQPYSQEIMEAAADALQCSVTDLLTVDPRIDDAVAELAKILRLASAGDQQRALEVVKAMLKTGTDA